MDTIVAVLLVVEEELQVWIGDLLVTPDGKVWEVVRKVEQGLMEAEPTNFDPLNLDDELDGPTFAAKYQ